VKSRFPPPSSIKQLEDIPHEEQHSIPLETIQNWYDPIPRRIQAVLQAGGGPTAYWERNVNLSQLFPLFRIHMSLHRNITPNYSQQDVTFLGLFIFTDALHVSGGSSAHH